MPKPKVLLKETQKKKSKHRQTTPSTADEYLAAAVSFEEAGEKWRGGDAAKSMRFFNRAIECYDEGLKRFPDSFDLAYNKSRAQYELTQHPKLLPLISKTILEHLEIALQSSRSALALKPDNPDVLFNTAQILTSIAEELDESPHPRLPNSLQALEEALCYFKKCLQLQEVAILNFREQTATIVSSSDSMDLDSNDCDDSSVPIIHDSSTNNSEHSVVQDDRWATVVEPITDDTLLDTILASLECLTTFCQLVSSECPHEFRKVEKYAHYFVQKLDVNLIDKNRTSEVLMIKASLTCAYATVQFCSSSIDLETYSQTIKNAYAEVDLSLNPKGLCDFAESLIAYNKVLRLYSKGDAHGILVARWKALTTAQEYLTSSCKISSAENLEKIYLARGDVELLRFQLGQNEIDFNIARENSTVLLKNAGKYYRGSLAIARNVGAETIAFEANVKEMLASALAEGRMYLEEEIMHLSQTRPIFEEAIEDGLVTTDQLNKLGLKLVF
ncbi:hypothetical protein EPUL_003484 [Erysiphe pulchra]|uniref:TPR-like protein n=1 Tax=Erysiphe pulchra TaxID=225359 RepID=A0A2S4PUS9_9PEZI|nr:hypothetical protein EPUL_003484 [Erysiphe pulchra]